MDDRPSVHGEYSDGKAGIGSGPSVQNGKSELRRLRVIIPALIRVALSDWCGMTLQIIGYKLRAFIVNRVLAKVNPSKVGKCR